MASFTTLYGFGNTVGGDSQSLDETVELFKEGVVTSLPSSFFINLFYAPVVSSLQETKHPRLYSNLFCAAVNVGVYTLFSSMGSENPLPMVASGATLGFSLTNLQVSKEQNKKQKNLESQISSNYL